MINIYIYILCYHITHFQISPKNLIDAIEESGYNEFRRMTHKNKSMIMRAPPPAGGPPHFYTNYPILKAQYRTSALYAHPLFL